MVSFYCRESLARGFGFGFGDCYEVDLHHIWGFLALTGIMRRTEGVFFVLFGVNRRSLVSLEFLVLQEVNAVFGRNCLLCWTENVYYASGSVGFFSMSVVQESYCVWCIFSKRAFTLLIKIFLSIMRSLRWPTSYSTRIIQAVLRWSSLKNI